MVLVDLFSKIAHFVSCVRAFDATCITHLYFKEIVQVHGIPKALHLIEVSNSLVIFWKTLCGKLGMKL